MFIKKLILNYAPVFVQNLGVTLFNYMQYRVRHSGDYLKFRLYYQDCETLDKQKIDQLQSKVLENFLLEASRSSKWYNNYKNIQLKDFPVLEKPDLLKYLDDIKTIDETKGIISLTGGTTGASMKVIYTKKDMQERFAILDHFRSKFGYELGKKTAWFSGKNIVRESDLKKGICYRDDYINKIKFFSTFHICEKNFEVYWGAIENYAPEFIVGFPSSVYEICEIADRRGLKLKKKVKVFFPTAETVLPQHREVIGRVLGCRLVDQYASSEGAPFILECEKGNLHIHPLTGVFEVVNENMQPALEGEILVTSFTTNGTPLIRYRVGDRIKLNSSNALCQCGSHFPIVEKIEGRTTDFVYSPEKGRINLGNLSNSTKDTIGIVCFQVIQNFQDEIDINVVVDQKYNNNEERKFIDAIKERVGNSLKIKINYVNDIPREKSGKFRIVKNNLSL